MAAIVLCIVAALGCYTAGRKSLGWGMLALLTVGYFYGILRANLPTSFSHFIFDCGLLGLYASQDWIKMDARDANRLEKLRWWVIALMLWCVLLVPLPFQPLLVSLVGWRGNAFFLPVLLLGARLKEEDLSELSAGMAVLNVAALAFAGAEYFKGVEAFYPPSAVTAIIYASTDVAGGYFRIPAIFANAHAFGGTMVATMPYLIGGWDRARTKRRRLLNVMGIAAALLGILMSATRQNFVLGAVLVLVVLVTRRGSFTGLVVFLLLIGSAMYVAMTNERFQRFKTLGDTSAVETRIAGSVNRGFFEILEQYPMGNGLGGGGTSIPYFLEGDVRNPIGMENEYARILCEQGIIGLLLFLGFVFWYFIRGGVAFANGPWVNSRRMVWCLAAFSLASSFMGTGLLTAIPQTPILLMGMGWTATFSAAAFVGTRVKAPVRRAVYQRSPVAVTRGPVSSWRPL